MRPVGVACSARTSMKLPSIFLQLAEAGTNSGSAFETGWRVFAEGGVVMVSNVIQVENPGGLGYGINIDDAWDDNAIAAFNTVVMRDPNGGDSIAIRLGVSSQPVAATGILRQGSTTGPMSMS